LLFEKWSAKNECSKKNYSTNGNNGCNWIY
jgi:hypothetical protein